MCLVGRSLKNYRNIASKRNWCAPYPNLPWAPNSYTDGYINATGDDDFEYVTSYLRVAGGVLVIGLQPAGGSFLMTSKCKASMA